MDNQPANDNQNQSSGNATPQTTGPQVQDTPFSSPASTVATDSNVVIPSIPAPEEPSGGTKATLKNFGNKKGVVATILGISLMIVGIGTGLVLISRQQLFRSKAWDCKRYTFNIGKSGTVSVNNSSSNNEPPQNAEVYINNELVAELDVPALGSGESATLGTVIVPTDGFNWEVRGTKDCSDAGIYEAEISAQCNLLKAFDSEWNELSSEDLSNLKAGDSVRFTALGLSTSGAFDRARFTVNGTQRAEVTSKRSGTDEFYDEYTVPAGVSVFNIKAEVHHQGLDKWF